jgi:hypothetical protein
MVAGAMAEAELDMATSSLRGLDYIEEDSEMLGRARRMRFLPDDEAGAGMETVDLCGWNETAALTRC